MAVILQDTQGQAGKGNKNRRMEPIQAVTFASNGPPDLRGEQSQRKRGPKALWNVRGKGQGGAMCIRGARGKNGYGYGYQMQNRGYMAENGKDTLRMEAWRKIMMAEEPKEKWDGKPTSELL